MAAIPCLDESHLEAICEVLADTSDGLTGPEIGRYLQDCGIADPFPTITKRHRLYQALCAKQREVGCANHVMAFIKKAMNPVLYHACPPEYFPTFRGRLNKPLAFAGYQVNERGEIVPVTAARTLSEAEARADRLQRSACFGQGRCTSDVLKFCRAELIQENYFHAVLEATKSLSEKIRIKSGLTGDAGELAQKHFPWAKPGCHFLRSIRWLRIPRKASSLVS